MNVPNALTVLRIALVPLFAALWIGGRPGAALVVLAISGISDVLDGLLARALDQRTRIGALLDPLADKLTILVAFLVAARVGALPVWLAALVIARDLLLGLTAVVMRLAGVRWDPRRFHPTRLGKYAAFYQLLTVVVALALHAGGSAATGASWLAALSLITATLTVVTGLQYLVRPNAPPSPPEPDRGSARMGS